MNTFMFSHCELKITTLCSAIVRAVIIAMNSSDSEVTHQAVWAQYLTVQNAADLGVGLTLSYFAGLSP